MTYGVEEEEKPKSAIENKTGVSMKGWLFFIAFLLWLGAQVTPYFLTSTTVEQNNRAVECIIQQLTDHRVHNDAAHENNADHHNYTHENGLETNIPIEVTGIDRHVCDDWLVTSRQNENSETGGLSDLFGR